MLKLKTFACPAVLPCGEAFDAAAVLQRCQWDELQQLFAVNRRLFKAYVLREQLDRLWTYKTRDGVARFLVGWLKALRWQRYPRWRNSVTRW